MQLTSTGERPYKLYRNKTGWPAWYQRWLEAWWIITGEWSFHKIWQEGMTLGSKAEYIRIVVNHGDGMLIPHADYNDYLDFKAKKEYK